MLLQLALQVLLLLGEDLLLEVQLRGEAASEEFGRLGSGPGDKIHEDELTIRTGGTVLEEIGLELAHVYLEVLCEAARDLSVLDLSLDELVRFMQEMRNRLIGSPLVLILQRFAKLVQSHFQFYQVFLVLTNSFQFEAF